MEMAEQTPVMASKKRSRTEDEQGSTPAQPEAKTIVRGTKRTGKRQDYLSWDDYFMAMASLAAMRSKDPSTQVGACIVDQDKKIVGMGYNGFPNGCSDDELPWDRKADDVNDTKYPYVCHAEMNAILNNNGGTLKGCSIYVALFPCNECTKTIIQAGIRKVIYLSDKYHDLPSSVASRRMLDLAGVVYQQHKTTRTSIQISFAPAE
jgi:dCMP deaminase